MSKSSQDIKDNFQSTLTYQEVNMRESIYEKLISQTSIQNQQDQTIPKAQNQFNSFQDESLNKQKFAYDQNIAQQSQILKMDQNLVKMNLTDIKLKNSEKQQSLLKNYYSQLSNSPTKKKQFPFAITNNLKMNNPNHLNISTSVVSIKKQNQTINIPQNDFLDAYYKKGKNYSFDKTALMKNSQVSSNSNKSSLSIKTNDKLSAYIKKGSNKLSNKSKLSSTQSLGALKENSNIQNKLQGRKDSQQSSYHNYGDSESYYNNQSNQNLNSQLRSKLKSFNSESSVKRKQGVNKYLNSNLKNPKSKNWVNCNESVFRMKSINNSINQKSQSSLQNQKQNFQQPSIQKKQFLKVKNAQIKDIQNINSQINEIEKLAIIMNDGQNFKDFYSQQLIISEIVKNIEQLKIGFNQFASELSNNFDQKQLKNSNDSHLKEKKYESKQNFYNNKKPHTLSKEKLRKLNCNLRFQNEREVDPCTGGTANICRYCKGGLIEPVSQSTQTKESMIGRSEQAQITEECLVPSLKMSIASMNRKNSIQVSSPQKSFIKASEHVTINLLQRDLEDQGPKSQIQNSRQKINLQSCQNDIKINYQQSDDILKQQQNAKGNKIIKRRSDFLDLNSQDKIIPQKKNDSKYIIPSENEIQLMIDIYKTKQKMNQLQKKKKKYKNKFLKSAYFFYILQNIGINVSDIYTQQGMNFLKTERFNEILIENNLKQQDQETSSENELSFYSDDSYYSIPIDHSLYHKSRYKNINRVQIPPLSFQDLSIYQTTEAEKEEQSESDAQKYESQQSNILNQQINSLNNSLKYQIDANHHELFKKSQKKKQIDILNQNQNLKKSQEYMDFVEGKSIIITHSEDKKSIHLQHNSSEKSKANIFKSRNITESAQNNQSKSSQNKRNILRTIEIMGVSICSTSFDQSRIEQIISQGQLQARNITLNADDLDGSVIHRNKQNRNKNLF